MKFLRSTAALLFFPLVIICSFACTNLTTGRAYTLCKVDKEGRLIDPNRLLKTERPDTRDTVTPSGAGLEIILDGGYLRYLEELKQTEVLFYVNVAVRKKDSDQEALVWQKVFLKPDDKQQQLIVNKDSRLPFRDILMVPPIKYDSDDVTVSIRVIELDKDDNARAIAVLNTIAAGAATFQPESAPAVALVQSFISFLIKTNADDIELAYDFTLSSSGEPVKCMVAGVEENCDLVLNPRSGKYVLIKTEHRGRKIPPDEPEIWSEEFLRYLLARSLRVGTLGVLNWSRNLDLDYEHSGRPLQDYEKDHDLYLRLLGDPFSIPKAATTPPEYDSSTGYLISRTSGNREFHLAGDDLDLTHTASSWNATPHLYRDQSFLVFSIVNKPTGFDLDAKKAKDSFTEVLGLLQDMQMSPTDLSNSLKGISSSFEGFVLSRQWEDDCREDFAKAKTKTQLDEAKTACENSLKEIEAKLSDETKGHYAEAGRRAMEEAATHRSDEIQGPVLKLLSDKEHCGEGPATLMVEHPAMEADKTTAFGVDARFKKAGEAADKFQGLSAVSQTEKISQDRVPSLIQLPQNPLLPPGVYDFEVWSKMQPNEKISFHITVVGEIRLESVSRRSGEKAIDRVWRPREALELRGENLQCARGATVLKDDKSSENFDFDGKPEKRRAALVNTGNVDIKISKIRPVPLAPGMKTNELPL